MTTAMFAETVTVTVDTGGRSGQITFRAGKNEPLSSVALLVVDDAMAMLLRSLVEQATAALAAMPLSSSASIPDKDNGPTQGQ